MLSQSSAIGSWTAQIITASIIGMTIPFKFMYPQETAAIFDQIGGRPIATLIGVAELIAVVLLLTPRTAAIGGLWAAGIMSGAIFSHLTVLGIDAGEGMFFMAIAAFATASTVTAIRRKQLPIIGAKFFMAQQAPQAAQVASA